MANAALRPLAKGFDDPVAQAQSAFRAAMNALATPGKLIPYRAQLEIDVPLPVNAAALGLALLDFEVGYHLAPSLVAPGLAAPSLVAPALTEAGDVEAFFRFHTGAKTGGAREAAFAFVDLERDSLRLSDYAQGTPEYPDRSTTIIALASSMTTDRALRITGPGIRHEAALTIAGLPTDFDRQWSLNRGQFPLGVDLIFALPDGLVGLPRSTRIIGETR